MPDRRLNSHKDRNDDKREFPSGLVLLGLSVVILAWLTVLGPHLPAFLSPQPVPRPDRPSQAAATRETDHPDQQVVAQKELRGQTPT